MYSQNIKSNQLSLKNYLLQGKSLSRWWFQSMNLQGRQDAVQDIGFWESAVMEINVAMGMIQLNQFQSESTDHGVLLIRVHCDWWN